jgi:hypothetical protein
MVAVVLGIANSTSSRPDPEPPKFEEHKTGNEATSQSQ